MNLPQILLNLNLPSYLLLNFAIYDLGLVQALESYDEMRGSVCARQVNASKLSFAKWTADGEVNQTLRSRRGMSDLAQSSR